ncbi:MAG: polyprenyl synthetase family protein [Candidatus Bathyarchaeota archaeon]|nr:polyprenyl synthetase family protein [Candidatus Bathyarchaeota archaeon]
MDHPKLREALEHYFANWNEFVHPGLLSLACEAVEGDPDDVIAVQAAIAMLTAAFDVHDDIIDKSKEKNKIATIYGKFGEGIALLLGNAFLIEGLKFFADSVIALSKDRERSTLEILRKLLFEVGNAHALEIGLKERKNITPSEYMKITEMKAASIEADMHFGALFGGGKDAEIAVLSRIGRILGILATLRDDLVDVFDIEELRQRISVQDLPIPLLFAMQDQEAKDKLVDILSKPKISKSDVATLVDITLTAPPVVHLKNQMRLLIEEGSNLTNRLPKKESRCKLQAILSFMLEDL